MKTDKEFADSVRRKANEYKQKEKKRRKAFAISATSLLLVVAITLGTVLPITLADKDGGEPTDYLSSFTATIERQPLNGMAGYDASVWDYDNCEWLNEYEYDAVLGDYPKSISAYLAYLLETNKSSGMHFWVKIECLNHESTAVRDLFVETMQNLDVPTDRTVLSYDDGEVGGLTGLWTRTEILDFAKKYEEQCPNNIYRKDGVRYVAGITVNITYELSELGSRYMDYYLFNAYNDVKDDEYVPVRINVANTLTYDKAVELTGQDVVRYITEVIDGSAIPNHAKSDVKYGSISYSTKYTVYEDVWFKDSAILDGVLTDENIDEWIVELNKNGYGIKRVIDVVRSEATGEEYSYLTVDDWDKFVADNPVGVPGDKEDVEAFYSVVFARAGVSRIKSQSKTYEIKDFMLNDTLYSKAVSANGYAEDKDGALIGARLNNIIKSHSDARKTLTDRIDLIKRGFENSDTRIVEEDVSLNVEVVVYMTKAEITEYIKNGVTDGVSLKLGEESDWTDGCVAYDKDWANASRFVW